MQVITMDSYLELQRPKLSDSNRETTASVDSLRAGINPAPTQWVGEPFVGAGFTLARGSYHSLQIAQFRKDLVFTAPGYCMLKKSFTRTIESA